MAPVGQLCRKYCKHYNFKSFELDQKKIIKVFSQGKNVSLVRSGDAEMRILENCKGEKDLFGMLLASTHERADLVGIRPSHRYGMRVKNSCERLGFTIDSGKFFEPVIFIWTPEFLSVLINGKKVIWVNYKAYKFPELMKNNKFCEFYGFRDVETVGYVDIPDGKNGNVFGRQSLFEIHTQVLDKLKKFHNTEIDLVLLGAGAAANTLSVSVRDELGYSAVDVGAFMSAMRGQRNRMAFIKGQENSFVVWGE